MAAITRFRGDTKGFTITIRDGKGNVVDIDQCTLKLSVSAVENPISEVEAAYEMQISGAIIAPPADGKFDIVFVDADVDIIGDFFFDIEFIDANGKITTLDKDTWTMKQDISK